MAAKTHEVNLRKRGRKWQEERMRALADRIGRGEVGEVTQADIDAIFEKPDAERGSLD